jgi:glycosyltransferase involved in cell wall biosynthesis
MKRLLIVTRTHTPEGGADRIISDVCRHLPARGWEVRLGLVRGARFNDPRRYLDLVGHDLPAVVVDGRIGTAAARVEALRSVLRAERPDIVLSMRVFDAYAAVIREKHDSRNAPRLAVGIRGFETGYLQDLARHADSVDLCVTSGELLADLAVEACGLPRERVASIGGGVHPAKHGPVMRNRRDRIALLYAGRLVETQKRIGDLPLLLDALDRLGVPFQLTVAGQGPEEAALRERLSSRISAGTVRLDGWVSRERLYAEHYPNADVFLHMAGWEGMTIAPREAMANGIVPVITRFRGLRREGQFVDGRNCLTFDVGDIEAAAQAVARLWRQPELLQRLSDAASQSQAGRYSFEGALDAWAEELDRCLESPVRVGAVPPVLERNEGRLARLALPASLETGLRRALRRPVRHQSPGSEWPTVGGSIDESAAIEFENRARAIDERSRGADADG